MGNLEPPKPPIVLLDGGAQHNGNDSSVDDGTIQRLKDDGMNVKMDHTRHENLYERVVTVSFFPLFSQDISEQS